MTYETNTTNTLLITRDGEVDTSYYKAVERAQRIESIKSLGANVIGAVGAATQAVAMEAGRAVLLGMARFSDDLGNTPIYDQVKQLTA